MINQIPGGKLDDLRKTWIKEVAENINNYKHKENIYYLCTDWDTCKRKFPENY